MQAKKTLRPGQDGTKRLMDKFGDQLLCVRYRYDPLQKVRHKTVELIIETIPWRHRSKTIPRDSLVGLKIDFKETELQTKVRQAGGRWNPESRRLELRYEAVLALGLESRIDPNSISTGGKKAGASKKTPV